jgi:hypothetical protein
MSAKCDYCDRPATWRAAWQTPTTPGPDIVAYACDRHRAEGMVPIDEPVQTSPDPGLDEHHPLERILRAAGEDLARVRFRRYGREGEDTS